MKVDKKRERKKPKEYEVVSSKLWTQNEMDLLHDALVVHKCDPHDYKLLQLHIRTRNVAEVKDRVDGLTYRSNNGYIAEVDSTFGKSPIEKWLGISEDLMYGIADYSYIIAHVMSVAGNLEPHDHRKHPTHPNYSLIYQYIVAVLRRETPPELRTIDAAVVSNLLQELADKIKHLDVATQMKLLESKLDLTTMKIDINNKAKSYNKIRIGLETDPFEEPDLGQTGPKGDSGQPATFSSKDPTHSGHNEDNGPSGISTGPAILLPNGYPACLTDTTEKPEVNGNDRQGEEMENVTDVKRKTIRKGYKVKKKIWRSHLGKFFQRKPEPPAGGRRNVPPLYSLNPFYIPVKYLKPSEKVILPQAPSLDLSGDAPSAVVVPTEKLHSVADIGQAPHIMAGTEVQGKVVARESFVMTSQPTCDTTVTDSHGKSVDITGT